jgi:hypothetical protein
MPAEHQWWCACLVSRIGRVRLPSPAPCQCSTTGRAPLSYSGGSRFETGRWLDGPVAHLVERRSCKAEVVGFDSDRVHARIAQLAGGPALRTRTVQVRILFRVRTVPGTHSGVAQWVRAPGCQAGGSRVRVPSLARVEGWPSGRRRRPAKADQPCLARVRIPPPPPTRRGRSGRGASLISRR